MTSTSTALRTDARTLPLIDLEAARRGGAERAELLARLRRAAHELGFFYVVGHGIPHEVQDHLFTAARTFFELPDEAKREVHNLRSPHFRGWTSLGTEHTAGAADEREQLDVGPERRALDLAPDDPPYLRLVGPNQWPAQVPELQLVTLRWLDEAERVARTVLSLLAEALGQDPHWFDPWFDDEAVVTTKLVRYPAGRRASSEQGVGAHKDYGWLALVLQDDHGGLQVRDDDGGWIDATPLTGTLVVNVGEALEVVTDGYLRANVHRVLAPEGDTDRYSVPFFLAPRLDAVVDPLPLHPTLREHARGVERDPANPLSAAYGPKALHGWLRSHPAVARRHHPDLLDEHGAPRADLLPPDPR